MDSTTGERERQRQAERHGGGVDDGEEEKYIL